MKLPSGVWFATKRLANGAKVRYGYYGRGRDTVALGREGTPDFFKNLAQLTEGSAGTETVQGLIVAYRQSDEFRKLADRTKRDYCVQLDRVRERFGPLSLKAIESKKIARYIFEWRDTLALSGVRQADAAVQVFRTLLNWGLARGYIDFNRALKIPKLYTSDRAAKVWSAADIANFADAATPPMRWALFLALYTGQRQADLLALTWSQVRPEEKVIVFEQHKTGAIATVPITPDLRQLLEDIPKVGDHVLTDDKGAPWHTGAVHFSQQFRAIKRKAGIVDRTFHDLRGTFVTRNLAAGLTAQQVALMSGHSMKSIGILDAYTNRGDVSLANAKRLAE